MSEKYILKQIKKTRVEEELQERVQNQKKNKSEVFKLERGTFAEKLRSDHQCFFLEYDKKAGFLLFFLFPKLNIEIAKRFKGMKEIQIAFTKLNGIGFLCFKLEDLNWIECCTPYSFFVQEDISNKMEIQLSFVIVKSDIGFIEDIYSVPLDKDFQKKLKKELCSLDKIGTEEEYERKIDGIYLRYNTPEKIKEFASLFTKISQNSSL